MVWCDKPGIRRTLLPDLAYNQRQQAQRAARLLEVGDRRHAQRQRIEQFGVEGVSRRQCLGIFGGKRMAGQSHVLLVPAAISRGVCLRDLGSGGGINSGEQTMAHNGGNFCLAGGGDHPFLSGGDFMRIG